MKVRALLVCVLLCAVVSGCATNKKWGQGTAKGALIGGAIGGAGGAGIEIGRGMDEAQQAGRGAAIGVAAGMVIGGLVGHALWDEVATPRPSSTPAPPEVTPPAAEAMPPSTATKIIPRSVNFDFERAEIRPDAMPVLDDAAAMLRAAPHTKVLIEGHTDSIGTEDFNLQLGHRRAEAVKKYLITKGIDANRFEVRSFGESQPVATNDTDDGRAQNRRAELRLHNGTP